ncbi:CD225/dispanin family protein [Streptomonospora litoralis]|uniref:Interferon-induced transmembrane protein n=1 Tax=Streptomonospora litoralis TaxID=2498135 RepID=A0A4V0ZJL9_9ACTN|nr:CD225/dispanin family protein [Streptomonospora litoralis]QBI53942.1 Interferon-induced transmembrane protein [Streptomonospora litoralis]
MSYGPPPPPPSQPPPGAGYGPPPGGPGGYAGGSEPPNNFLVPAILSMFCCWPFAIPAILAAAKVNELWNLGDFAGAQERADRAKRFAIIALVVGILIYVVTIVGYFALFAAVLSTAPTTTAPGY